MLSRILEIINLVVLTCVVAISLLADANGRFLAMAELTSKLIALSLFGCGIALSTVLAVRYKDRRIVALICLGVYVVLGAPAVLPI